MTAKKPMGTARLVIIIIASIVGIIILALTLLLSVPYYLLQSKFSIKESPTPAASAAMTSSTASP